MKKTVIQKIFEAHTAEPVAVDDIVDLPIDVRLARDFGGASVVKHLQDHGLALDDPAKTFFTFDCNPGGCDQKYAMNQQFCRQYARANNVMVFDINRGIGTHLVMDTGLVGPMTTCVSTDSHANILGAVGAFGQGMGDIDIAYAFAHGTTWFKVPPTVLLNLTGTPSPHATAKDVALKCVGELGANGLLGCAAELSGDYVKRLSLDERITITSMATEMGAISLFFPPLDSLGAIQPKADPDAPYQSTLTIDIDGLGPLVARPGHPEDVVALSEVEGTVVDSGFIGSCTNGRLDDLRRAAQVLSTRHIAPQRVLKVVPATDDIWNASLREGLLQTFKTAGALVGSAGCAGCAAGQIGQTGAGEVTVSTGNRNFSGKQGKGDIYLASPETVAASLAAGYLTTPLRIPSAPAAAPRQQAHPTPKSKAASTPRPLAFEGKAWVVDKDNIDTDMIYHNRYLSITAVADMGQYTFDNLKGFESFASQARPGDIVVSAKNFGCGSSRQQAVDCFKSLGIALIIAESFGAIYERNAINSALPILTAPGVVKQTSSGDVLSVDVTTGRITNRTTKVTSSAAPFSKVQRDIYLRGGLLGG